PMLMAGYRLRPDLDAEALVDGWLVTADRGELSAEGTLRVLGRTDDVVVTGGENVSADDVAAVLAGHPDLADAAVTGVADEQWGQRLVAVVVARAGHSAPAVGDLRSWCADRLAAAARPQGIVVVDAIPRLSSGKLDRRAVARLADAASGDPSG
ncbi:MAG TPA: AMP-dependent synthetase, partial [Mycobacteriales bacterium]|nr:AMP-dependent synthetase [Mycobacteriales bacterium]